ncbi:PEP-CTERM sorting domain-containing protein [Isosphaeraceae bacterium EP7]
MNWRLLQKFALGVAAVAFGTAAPAAHAGFVPILDSPAPGGAASVFTYSLIFSSNGGSEQLTDGDVLTLYDFGAGVTDPSSVVMVSSDFSVTVQNLGFTPVPSSGSINPVDSASIANISFTYNGQTLFADATFFATITLNGAYTTRSGEYASQNAFPAAPGGTNTQIGAVFVSGAAAVPEPASVVLMGLGVVVTFGSLARRRLAGRPA